MNAFASISSFAVDMNEIEGEGTKVYKTNPTNFILPLPHSQMINLCSVLEPMKTVFSSLLIYLFCVLFYLHKYFIGPKLVLF